MLSEHQVREVRALLAAGELSHRGIALRTGISRGSIGAIAAGTRKEPYRAAEREEPKDLGPVVRCPTCGGRVHAPCRLCRVRGQEGERRAARSIDRRQTADRREFR